MKTNTRLFVAVILFVCMATSAQDGTLDTTFGVGGIVTTDALSTGAQVNSLVVDSQGKIIRTGRVFDYSSFNQAYVVKNNTDGTPDNAFGNKGIIIINGEVYLQTDGKFIVYGLSSLQRYNNDSTLDTTFGVGGTIMRQNTGIITFSIQPDGKMIILESLSANSLTQTKMTRLNTNGDLDISFGASGVVMISDGSLQNSLSNSNFNGLVVQSDGKILLSGTIGASDKSNFIIIRYDKQGMLDPSFNKNGILITDIDAFDNFSIVKLQNDDKILLATSSSHQDSQGYYIFSYNLIRLLSDGRNDTSFGKNGAVKMPINPNSIVKQSDGKIVITGQNEYIEAPPNQSFVLQQIGLLRYMNDGTLDPTFGNGGLTLTPNKVVMGFEGSILNCIGALEQDGKIIIAADACEAHLSCHPRSLMLRYNSSQDLANYDFDISKNAFAVYPNPANQIINIDFNLAQSETLSIDLYDSSGRNIKSLVKEKDFQSGYTTQQLELPVSLSVGLYFLNISNGKNTSIVKIVK